MAIAARRRGSIPLPGVLLMPELFPKAKPTRAKKPKRPAMKRLSPALGRIAQRSLEVDPSDVDRYAPLEIDLKIAEAMLMGEITFAGIADHLELSAGTVSHRLSDPLTCAWVSRVVHRSIQNRLGMVDAAMLNKAVNGDTRAAGAPAPPSPLESPPSFRGSASSIRSFCISASRKALRSGSESFEKSTVPVMTRCSERVVISL